MRLIDGGGQAEAGIDLARRCLQPLASAGLTRVLVEGGAELAGALLRAGLVDRLAWFHAPARHRRRRLAGGAALGIGGWPTCRASIAHRARALGADMLTVYAVIGGAGLMFTGIVTAVGKVRSVSPLGAGRDMRLVSRRPGRTRRASRSAPRSPARAAA